METQKDEKPEGRYKTVEEGKKHYRQMASQQELAKSLLDPDDYEAYIKSVEKMTRERDEK